MYEKAYGKGKTENARLHKEENSRIDELQTRKHWKGGELKGTNRRLLRSHGEERVSL